MSNLNEERLKKFRDMGLPMPMAPVDPSMLKGPVKNLEFAAKLEAIKRGVKKEEISTFIEKEKPANGFVPLEVKKPKGNQPKKELANEGIKPLSTSGPDFSLYEKALYGDNTPSSASFERASVPGRAYKSDMTEEVDNGSNFLADLRARLAEKATKPNQENRNVLLDENHNRNKTIPAGHTLINEKDLKEAITLISSDVCKQLIKKFMTEFISKDSGLIKESEKIKKAEIIRDDIVKIDGNFFKITPVTVKKK